MQATQLARTTSLKNQPDNQPDRNGNHMVTWTFPNPRRTAAQANSSCSDRISRIFHCERAGLPRGLNHCGRSKEEHDRKKRPS
eukprot:347716-Chlamydomonas_euryale.AAC.1